MGVPGMKQLPLLPLSPPPTLVVILPLETRWPLLTTKPPPTQPPPKLQRQRLPLFLIQKTLMCCPTLRKPSPLLVTNWSSCKSIVYIKSAYAINLRPDGDSDAWGIWFGMHIMFVASKGCEICNRAISHASC